MKVLITGGSGILGTALMALDAEKVFLDRKPCPECIPEELFTRGDANDQALVEELLEGCDAVIHAAGCSDSQSADLDVLNSIVEDNIRCVTTVFQAAKKIGVGRIIYCSSNHVVGLHELENAPRIYDFGHGVHLDENADLKPDSLYGVSKLFGEFYGRLLASIGGPKFYALRIGSVRSASEDHPYAYAEWGVRKGLWKRGSLEYTQQENRLKAIWQSRRDFVQLVEKTLRYEGPQEDIFYGVSHSERGWLDIQRAREALDYKPQDSADSWIQIMADEQGELGARPKLSSHGKSLSVVGIVPVRVSSIEDREMALKLLPETAKIAARAKHIDELYLYANDDAIVDLGKSLGMSVPYQRPDSLSEATVRADMVIQDFVHRMDEDGFAPDLVAPLEITFPFRPVDLLDDLYERLFEEELDTVIAGYAEYRPTWATQTTGMVRLDQHLRARNERDPLHVGLPSLGCVTYAEFLRKGSRLGNRVGITHVKSQLASLEIRSTDMLPLLASLKQSLEDGVVFSK